MIGGTTPGYTLFEQVKKETGLPVRVLIRPRFGDFLYTHYEYQQMLADIRHFSQAGADGVVIGSLNTDGTLNEAVSYTHLDVYKRQGLWRFKNWINWHACGKYSEFWRECDRS